MTEEVSRSMLIVAIILIILLWNIRMGDLERRIESLESQLSKPEYKPWPQPLKFYDVYADRGLDISTPTELGDTGE